jgi:hypothetical protein
MRTGSEVIKMTKRQKQLFFLRLGVSGKISAATVLAVIAGLSYFAYIQWIEPRLEAANFEDSLAEFGAPNFHIPNNSGEVPEGEVPYRIGKVLAVIPEHKIYMKREGEIVIVPAKIHPVWYKLDGETRASDPDEVNTLIRISRDLKGARRYQRIGGVESKIVSAHIIHIDVYDWENQTYIGRWTLDPGDP